MSNSVFKEYPSSFTDSEDTKVDSNLVVFINKNGSVSVDQSALQSLLINDAVDTKTSVSVLRVGSPTPSLELELEQEASERSTELSEKMDSIIENDEKNGNQSSALAEQEDDIPHVSVTVENFFVPEEAKKLASDILNIAGITNPLQISVDYDFQRYVIANDHCYTPFTSPSQRKTTTALASAAPTAIGGSPRTKDQKLKGVNKKDSKFQSTNQQLQKQQQPHQQATAKSATGTTEQQSDEEDKESGGEQENSESEESYFSPSESDRDSDLDFNVNDRPSRLRKTIAAARNKRNKQKLSRIMQKRKSATEASIESSEEISATPPLASASAKKKALNKNTKKISNIRMASMSNVKMTKVTAIGQKMKPKPDNLFTDNDYKNEKQPENNATSIATAMKEQILPTLAPISTDVPVTIGATPKVQAPPQPKKEKKPPAHVEALFSDMTSLFSTPDIIKKVNDQADIKAQQNPSIAPIVQSAILTTTATTISIPPVPSTAAISTVAITNTPIHTPTTATVNANKGYFMPITPNTSKTRQHLPAQISVRTHTTTTSLASEQDKQLDLIDSIVQKELHQTVPSIATSMSEDIPNIVKMLENPEEMLNNVMNMNPTTSVQQPSTTVSGTDSITYPAAITNDTQLLDDSTLLDGLGTADDGLSEDLLQHVAKLVEDKNLQEVIDKQVLGVRTSTSKLPTTTMPVTSVKSTTVISQQQKDSSINLDTLSEMGSIPVKDDSHSMSMSHGETSLMGGMTPRSKEPIKIVRADGRVITLPPIEAPTTRGAKRRAQNLQTPEPPKRKMEVLPTASSTPVAKEKELKDRRGSGAKKPVELEKPVQTPTIGGFSKKTPPVATTANDEDDEDDLDEDSDESYNSEDDPYRLWCICRQPHNNRFMICCDKCEDWFHGKCVNITKAMGMEMEERGVEWVCPNCLKKQQPLIRKHLEPKPKPIPVQTTQAPVVVTPPTSVASVSSFENSMLSCIVCKKLARPNSIYCSDDCIRRHAQSTASSIVVSQSEQNESAEKPKKPTAITLTQQKTPTQMPAKQPTPGTVTTKMEILKNKNRVVVFEKRTGRCLTGNTAPTVENLKQWLQDHPTFEVVTPGSAQALAIKAKQQQLKQIAKDAQAEKQSKLFSVGDQKVQTTLKVGPQKKLLLVNPQKQSTPAASSPTSSTPGNKQPIAKQPPKLVKIPQQVTLKPGSPTKTTISTKSQTPPTKSSPVSQQVQKPTQNKRKQTLDPSPSTPPNRNDTEPIRVNVQRTLKEQLQLRSSEAVELGCPKLSDDEIGKFAEDTEYEIYHLFNKDTGSKYRAKYRSLMFNIKDRKNQTLFQKICSKVIDAKQLVRMSPEELASQELAMWRENENKHQLEMIKKSELDLLACAKNYVLKTHKGEEVIESKTSDRVTLDPSVSVEDVVSVLNNSTVSSTSENVGEASPVPLKDTRIDSRFDKYLSVDSSSGGNVSKSHSSSTGSSSSTSKKKESRRSRSRSRDRHESKKSSSSSKHKRKRSRERERERRSKSRDRDARRDERNRTKEKDRSTDINSQKKEKERLKSSSSTSTKDSTQRKVDSEATHKVLKDQPKPLKKEDNFNLIDKIIEAQSTIDRILNTDESQNEEADSKSSVTQSVQQVKKLASSESDQEPSSTVTIPTPPEGSLDKESPKSTGTENTDFLWSGTIVMIDLATFQIGVRAVSGDCVDLEKHLPGELDVVGRISPETVWDYIGKIKKSINKEILILRFVETSPEEREAYYTLYKYLYSRKRLGVIKTTSTCIKDFYVAPLARHKSLPSVLMPINGVGFEDDRPDMLLGIIVKITSPPPRARPVIPVKVVRVQTTETQSSAPTVVPKPKSVTYVAGNEKTVDDEQYTPPGSPKKLDKLKMPPKKVPPLPVFPKSKELPPPPPAVDDGDEPYSPGGSDHDDDDGEDVYVPPKVTTTPKTMTTSLAKVDISPSQMEQDEIQRKMDELNRQIEAQKMEIAGMLQPQLKRSSVIDEPYSPTSVTPIVKTTIPALANISIPSNLQEILNSIKNATSAPASTVTAGQDTVTPLTTTGTGSMSTTSMVSVSSTGTGISSTTLAKTTTIGNVDNDDDEDDDEYTPVAVAAASYNPSADYIPSKTLYKPEPTKNVPSESMMDVSRLASVTDTDTGNGPSKLAQLTEEELLKLVPDEAKIDIDKPPPNKKAKYTVEPPPPGLEDEYVP